MKVPSFRGKSPLERSQLSKIPPELICIYDSLNNESYGSLDPVKTESDDLNLAGEYNDFYRFSSIHSNEDYLAVSTGKVSGIAAENMSPSCSSSTSYSVENQSVIP